MHVCIVGGGISGLYSALLLQKLGHKITIYEASSRLGGRIYTHHFDSPDSHAYFEAGAMRIPCSPLHKDVFNLIRYINTHGPKSSSLVELIPYILETKNNASYILGQKSSTCLAGDDPALPVKLGLPKEFHCKSARELLEGVISPWILRLEKGFDAGFEEVVKYDELSFRQYLRIVARWPHEVVDFVETVLSQSNQYDLSFTEIIMQNLDFNTKEWATIRGGMSNLITAASNLIGTHNIHLNTAVTSISANSSFSTVTITTSNQSIPPQTFSKTILAIPPSSLHNLLSRPLFAAQKEQAIRSLHFEPLYKMGIHFKTRFWEKGELPCFGGQSTTDLRFRWIVYPSNDLGSHRSGVLLLYCWMNDALRWTSLPQSERIKLALYDLSLFYKDYKIERPSQDSGGTQEMVQVDVYSEFISAFDISWSNDSATGDAMFLPGQFSRFRHVMSTAECNGTIHFAGEHLSRHHTWIAGALDSCLTTVREIVGDSEGIYVKALGAELENEEAKESAFGGSTGSRINAIEMATGIVMGKGRKVDAGARRLGEKRSMVDMGVF